MRYRIKLTIEDYYDYVGTSPWYSLGRRVRDSLPSTFQYGELYNVKFKRVKYHSWHRWYRVSFSIDITEEEILEVIKENEGFMHQFEDLAYKPIVRRPKRSRPATDLSGLKRTEYLMK